MSNDVPPLLIVSASNTQVIPQGIDVSITAIDPSMRTLLEAFAVVLVGSRTARGLSQTSLRLADDATNLLRDDQDLVFPHVCRAADSSEPVLIWEAAARDFAEAALAADASLIEHWAARPDLILRLATASGSEARTGEGEHLSFRWLLRNQLAAGSHLASAALDHVSLHCSPDAAGALADLLIDGLGLVEVARPASIPTPGRWFVASNAMIHLSTREVSEASPLGTGSAPNHVCLAVADLQAVRRYLEAASLDHTTAGSLTDVSQLWVRLGNNVTIEVQGPPESR